MEVTPYVANSLVNINIITIVFWGRTTGGVKYRFNKINRYDINTIAYNNFYDGALNSSSVRRAVRSDNNYYMHYYYELIENQ